MHDDAVDAGADDRRAARRHLRRRVGTRTLIVAGLASRRSRCSGSAISHVGRVAYTTMLAPFIVGRHRHGLVFAPSSTAVLANMRAEDTREGQRHQLDAPRDRRRPRDRRADRGVHRRGRSADADRLRGCRDPRGRRRRVVVLATAIVALFLPAGRCRARPGRRPCHERAARPTSSRRRGRAIGVVGRRT